MGVPTHHMRLFELQFQTATNSLIRKIIHWMLAKLEIKDEKFVILLVWHCMEINS